MDIWDAASAGDAAAVRSLLSKGVDPNGRKHGQTPLIYAAEGGHVDVIELLLSIRVDVDAKDSYAQTALHWAARNSQTACVQRLVAEGAEVGRANWMGETALHIATVRTSLDIIKALQWGDTGPYERRAQRLPPAEAPGEDAAEGPGPAQSPGAAPAQPPARPGAPIPQAKPFVPPAHRPPRNETPTQGYI